METYYQILGLWPSPSEQEITQKYREKIKEVNPDKNPNGSHEAFFNLKTIYDTLSDKKRRDQYDAQMDSKKEIQSGHEDFQAFYEKSLRILKEYKRKIKNKENRTDLIYWDMRYLEEINKVLNQKKEGFVLSSDKKAGVLSYRLKIKRIFGRGRDRRLKLSDALYTLSCQYKNKLALELRPNVLRFQDDFYAYISNVIKSSSEGTQLFGTLPKMKEYNARQPLLIHLDLFDPQDDDVKVLKKRNFIVNAIQKSPFKDDLAIMNPKGDKNLFLKLNIENFQRKKEASLVSGSSQADKEVSGKSENLQCKEDLIKYIRERSAEEKHPGFKLGPLRFRLKQNSHYSREAKIEAAQSLVDILSGRKAPDTIEKIKNLKALNQGRLKNIAAEAIAYIDNSRPKR